MDKKKYKFKLIRFLFYCLGFPAMCLATLWLLVPTFTEPAMGKYGLICAIVPFAIWGIVELLRIALKKLSKKGSLQRDYSTIILTVTTLALIVIPMFTTDWVAYYNYENLRKEAAQKEDYTFEYENLTIDEKTGEIKSTTETKTVTIYNGVSLPSYGKLMGWAIDNTNKGSSWFHGYVGTVNSFISSYGLKGFDTSRKGFAESKKVDYDINYDGKVDKNDYEVLGLSLGFYDKLEEQSRAKYTYSKLSAELNARYNSLQNIQSQLSSKIADLNAKIEAIEKGEGDPNLNINDLKQKLSETQKTLDNFNRDYAVEMQQLRGQTIRIYDSTIKNIVDLISQVGIILPDGLNIDQLLGMDLPIGDIVAFLGNIIDSIKDMEINGESVVDLILGLIPTEEDENGKYIVIKDLGLCKRSERHNCATYVSKVVSDKYSYEGIREIQYKVSIYPQLLCFARLRRILYIFCGLMIISILVTDHYSRKIDYIRDHEFEERLQRELKERGYVLATDVAVENNNYEATNDIYDTSFVDNYVESTDVVTDAIDESNLSDVSTTNDSPSNESDTPWPTGLDLSEGGNDNEIK